MSRTEKVLVLYGSQTGNSEQAAKDVCDSIGEKLSTEQVKVVGEHMQLDDFLELDYAAWTRLVVIVVSSYGVGGAPLGSYRFRELCDYWAEEKPGKILEGIHFAMCGLGDSKYTTFFENPTKIHQTLIQVGATFVGTLGKADMSGMGNEAQPLVIQRWIDGVWDHLAKVVVKEPLSDDVLQEIQDRTIDVCRKINPDFKLKASGSSSLDVTLVGALLVVFVAMAAYLLLQKLN